jgi:universal stress protein E
MPTINKIFVVIDPTTDNQAALDNAAWLASHNKGVSLHVYEAVSGGGTFADEDAMHRVELARHQIWVESLVAPIRAAGNAVTVSIEWTDEWRDAIAPAAEKTGADLIVKAASSRSVAGRRLLKTSDWTLLRAAHCPVYLIKKDNIEENAKVLAALDLGRDDEVHTALNELVLEYSRNLVESAAGASLHAVNAYASSESFVSPPDLAEKVGIYRTEAHTAEGAPESVIPDVAETIDADIVVIGTAARVGVKGAVVGNTAEKILDALHTNILTVNVE